MNRTANPGDVVLFRIGTNLDTAEPIVRPLLVCRTTDVTVASEDENIVWGELFLFHEEDYNCEWVTKNCFYRPDKDHRMIYVRGAYWGDKVGQWQRKATKPSSKLTTLESKLTALEKALAKLEQETKQRNSALENSFK